MFWSLAYPLKSYVLKSQVNITALGKEGLSSRMVVGKVALHKIAFCLILPIYRAI